jgi:hypothetical protein
MAGTESLNGTPLALKRYVLGTVIASAGFLSAWLLEMLLKWKIGFLLVLVFPILVLVSLCPVAWLSGWKNRLVGLLCWFLVWLFTYVIAVALMFEIFPP